MWRQAEKAVGTWTKGKTKMGLVTLVVKAIALGRTGDTKQMMMDVFAKWTFTSCELPEFVKVLSDVQSR